MDQELHQLIQEAKRKNDKAFEEIVRRFKGPVYRQAYGILNDRMEAEDVVQEAFVKSYFALSKLESAYAFSAWLNRIVIHLCYDRIQKRKRERAYMSDWLNQHFRQSYQPEALEQKRLQLSIEEAMNKLSPEHRAIILLRDVQGYSYEEIAKILKIPQGTVKSRLHSARLSDRLYCDQLLCWGIHSRVIGKTPMDKVLARSPIIDIPYPSSSGRRADPTRIALDIVRHNGLVHLGKEERYTETKQQLKKFFFVMNFSSLWEVFFIGCLREEETTSRNKTKYARNITLMKITERGWSNGNIYCRGTSLAYRSGLCRNRYWSYA